MSTGFVMLGIAPGNMMGLGIAGILIAGIFLPITNGPLNAVIQSTVEPSMQGRLFTLLYSLAGAMIPLGLILAGPLSDLLNIQTWYIVGGAVSLGFGVCGLFSKSLLGIEERAEPGGRLPDLRPHPTDLAPGAS